MHPAKGPAAQLSAAEAARSFKQRNAGSGIPPWALHDAAVQEPGTCNGRAGTGDGHHRTTTLHTDILRLQP